MRADRFGFSTINFAPESNFFNKRVSAEIWTDEFTLIPHVCVISMCDGQNESTAILFSSNLKRSVEFYNCELGFVIESTDKSLWLTYSNLKLKVISTDDSDLTSNMGVVFNVKNIHDLYQRLFTRSVPTLGRLCHTPFGELHFSLKDPDGNSLYFREYPRL